MPQKERLKKEKGSEALVPTTAQMIEESSLAHARKNLSSREFKRVQEKTLPHQW
jgi:hypothetical protein